MEDKTTDNYNNINPKASVGNKPIVFKIDIPTPKVKSLNKNKVAASIMPVVKKTKKRPCSGCSRKRKSG
jgi:hypothetical protein